jgi:hypothetical protein
LGGWSRSLSNNDPEMGQNPAYDFYTSRYVNHAFRIRYRRDQPSGSALRTTVLRVVQPERNNLPLEELYLDWRFDEIAAMEKIDLEIPPGEPVSPPVLLEVPAVDPSWQGGVGDLERQHYFAELQRLPEVLAVNSNFDEGIIEASPSGSFQPV